jgi:hypothetical protein
MIRIGLNKVILYRNIDLEYNKIIILDHWLFAASI